MKAHWLLLLTVAACDARAKASDTNAGGAPARGEQKSKHYESCGASMHCGDDLRCFDNVCVKPQRSTVGDYFAAVGREKFMNRDLAASIAAFKEALGHYETAKVTAPADVDCAYGAALAQDAGNRESAEMAARVLHRCVLATPAGSSLRENALGSLARLGDAGLDPLLLGGDKLADTYLTKGPVKPATDKLGVTVTAEPPPVKSFPLMQAKFSEEPLKKALVACWEQYNASSKKGAVAVTIGLKGAYVQTEYEDELVYRLKIDPAEGLPEGTPEAAANKCVRAVAEPAIKALKLGENFTTKLTISVN